LRAEVQTPDYRAAGAGMVHQFAPTPGTDGPHTGASVERCAVHGQRLSSEQDLLESACGRDAGIRTRLNVVPRS
jgi:hypothetical protein